MRLGLEKQFIQEKRQNRGIKSIFIKTINKTREYINSVYIKSKKTREKASKKEKNAYKFQFENLKFHLK